ncbi:bifunctional UDP-N-acetylglucosamine diphosphorylase/glucosamine-1-phosphate N-acetyltransferase GlmU [Leptolyngbya ohadii]|uniref:bifunctional UDP-N-acetylglucosamine diphosphorylase/glucosamine-1-phosphate N-acetyltransferase GlmU n=1 Tax=Leptolyngbya ohadii TaxID=1962290 RepID=UPI000B5A12FF|nr:bifunctional UDP-N-acetylglucosamine diphosphorylase/glucosamine-1-phosphate N-acetyltransferase GlmU [Leptolyngbya ohadii]
MVAVAILAAGRGTRMKSQLPKVLHSLSGRSLLERVLNCAASVQPSRRLVIVGFGADQVSQSIAHLADVELVEQREQLGTGHAVQQLMPHLQGFEDDLIVLNGDVPLLRPKTLQALLETHKTNGNAATILTAQLDDPKGYGRVFCDSANRVTQMVEDKDCSPEQKQNRRINAGIYCFNWAKLAQVLPTLQNNNNQQEYYLTDAVTALSPVMAVDVEDCQEILGINDRQQLADADRILQTRIKQDWMKAGVTLVDPDSIRIEDEVRLEPDVIIEPQTHLRGKTLIRSGSRIGPGSLIENSEIGENTIVLFSVISDSVVQATSRIGPYSHLRGHVDVGQGCRIGNFVELKNARLGDRTNVAHLSYIGDATLGNRVNIGAGTITANYDGVQKHRTEIGDRSKTGSNSVLVAPLKLGADVTVAAGSVVTDSVPDDCLVVARARQVVKPGWRLNRSNGVSEPLPKSNSSPEA